MILNLYKKVERTEVFAQEYGLIFREPLPEPFPCLVRGSVGKVACFKPDDLTSIYRACVVDRRNLLLQVVFSLPHVVYTLST